MLLSVLRVLFQAAQPRGERAAPDPDAPARQPHGRRAFAPSAPAVERGPGHPQLGRHLLDRQQRVIAGPQPVRPGSGGPARNGARPRNQPVRGSTTTDAPLRPPRQVRSPADRRWQSAARNCGREQEGRGSVPQARCAPGRARTDGLPCRRGRPAQPGEGSQAVTNGAAPPLPRAVAADPAAGRRGALACRPGPQASTLHSGRRVKPARTMVRTAQARTIVAHAPDVGRQSGAGVPACGRRVVVTGELVMGGLVPRAAVLLTHSMNPVSKAFFHPLPGNRCWRARTAGCCGRADVSHMVLSWTSRGPVMDLTRNDAGQRPDGPGREQRGLRDGKGATQGAEAGLAKVHRAGSRPDGAAGEGSLLPSPAACWRVPRVTRCWPRSPRCRARRPRPEHRGRAGSCGACRRPSERRRG